MVYRVVTAANPEEAELKINQLAAQGWTCLAVGQPQQGYIMIVMQMKAKKPHA